jgi:hypothetical protein
MKRLQRHLRFARLIRLLALAGASLGVVSCGGRTKELASDNASFSPPTSEKAQAETVENWQEIIHDSGRDEVEKTILLTWAKDPNGISLLRHLSVKSPRDHGLFHTALPPIANPLVWRDTFSDAASAIQLNLVALNDAVTYIVFFFGMTELPDSTQSIAILIRCLGQHPGA